MYVYAMWVNQRYGTQFDKIKGEFIFIREPENPIIVIFDENTISEYKKYITEICDVWIAINSIDDCKAIPGKNKCKYCKYLKICEEGKSQLE